MSWAEKFDSHIPDTKHGVAHFWFLDIQYRQLGNFQMLDFIFIAVKPKPKTLAKKKQH